MPKYSLLNKNGNAWEFGFAGCKIDSCNLSSVFQLQLMYDNSVVLIRIETAFTVTVNGAVYRLDPANTPPTEMGMAFAMLHKDITSITSSDKGRFEIRFTDDISLAVDPDPRYEAWTITGPRPKHFIIICIPGGEPSIWSK